MTSSITPITMPKWGIEMTEGTITAWNFAEGQAVGKGDSLLEVETEKIVNSVDSPAGGTLRRILAPAGETRAVGSLIAVFAAGDVPEQAIESFIASFKGASVSFEPDAPEPAAAGANMSATVAAASTAATFPPEDGDVRISPIARRLAERLNVDLSQVKGTGRNGRISKEDVEAHAAAMQSRSDAGTSANEPRRVRMSGMRATIAKRLLESKQSIPHYRLSVDVDTAALGARKQQLASSAGTKITLNDLLIRATALALVRHPSVNAQLQGDEVLEYPHADIAIAVATENGLITPIVRQADLKSVAEIATAVRDLVARAGAGSLVREDIAGGTFTISNLGMHGISRFDAIINPPQVAILAAGAAAPRVVAREGSPVVANIMTLTLSADHRVVDGAVGAAFLATLRTLLESADSL